MSAADRKMINESSAADIRCCGGDDGMMLLLLVMLIICYIIYRQVSRPPVSRVPPAILYDHEKEDEDQNHDEYVGDWKK